MRARPGSTIGSRWTAPAGERRGQEVERLRAATCASRRAAPRAPRRRAPSVVQTSSWGAAGAAGRAKKRSAWRAAAARSGTPTTARGRRGRRARASAASAGMSAAVARRTVAAERQAGAILRSVGYARAPGWGAPVRWSDGRRRAALLALPGARAGGDGHDRQGLLPGGRGGHGHGRRVPLRARRSTRRSRASRWSTCCPTARAPRRAPFTPLASPDTRRVERDAASRRTREQLARAHRADHLPRHRDRGDDEPGAARSSSATVTWRLSGLRAGTAYLHVARRNAAGKTVTVRTLKLGALTAPCGALTVAHEAAPARQARGRARPTCCASARRARRPRRRSCSARSAPRRSREAPTGRSSADQRPCGAARAARTRRRTIVMPVSASRPGQVCSQLGGMPTTVACRAISST